MILKMTLRGTTRELDMDRNRVTLNEERSLIAQLGWTWPEWIGHLAEEHPDAQAFAWWVACRRDGEPTDGKARDLDWAYGDMVWEAISDDDPEEPGGDEADGAEPRPTSSEPTDETLSVDLVAI